MDMLPKLHVSYHSQLLKKTKRTQDSSYLQGQQENTGHNKERQKSQPPRRRNRGENSNPEQK